MSKSISRLAFLRISGNPVVRRVQKKAGKCVVAYGLLFQALMLSKDKTTDVGVVSHRAALMTGCYPKRVGLATGCFGKWHLGDQPEFLPTNYGFDAYFGILYSNDMWLPHPETTRWKVTPPPLPVLRNNNVIERRPMNEANTMLNPTSESRTFTCKLGTVTNGMKISNSHCKRASRISDLDLFS